jgi:hypothetical protein
MRARTSGRRAPAAGLAAALLLALAGCSGPKWDYAEVEGKVTLGQQPLAGVNVTFYPDSEGAEQLPYATGKTDASGRYALTSVSGKAGALVGKNRVVVNWPLRERRDDRDRGPPPPPPGPPIPLPYTVASQTPLLVEVKAGGRQTIDLPLQQK